MYHTATSAPHSIQLAAPLARLKAQLPSSPVLKSGAATASAAAREQLLGFLALNSYFTDTDLADLRELLTRYPAAAVYNAVQQACQQRQPAPDAASRTREAQLSKVLLSALFHFACQAQLTPMAA
jgi:hypothetical protein